MVVANLGDHVTVRDIVDDPVLDRQASHGKTILLMRTGRGLKAAAAGLGSSAGAGVAARPFRPDGENDENGFS